MIAKSLLWRIRKDDLPSSYLFGTMHVKDDVAFAHIDKAITALYACRGFMTEIDLSKAQTVIQPMDYCIPNGGKISELLGFKKFNKASAILRKAFDFDLSTVDRLWPIFVINKLTESLLNEDNSLPLDAYLWEQANRLNMNCTGLEEPEDQIKVLNALDLDTQLKMLKDTVKKVSKFKTSINSLIKGYADEDIQLLFKKSSKSLGAFRNLLLFERNINMVDKIESHNATATFYALGAAHLAGQKGILNLLKKRGYTLKPIY